MRRMRGIAWYHFLLVVPVIALGLGTIYFSGKRFPVFENIRKNVHFPQMTWIDQMKDRISLSALTSRWREAPKVTEALELEPKSKTKPIHQTDSGKKDLARKDSDKKKLIKIENTSKEGVKLEIKQSVAQQNSNPTEKFEAVVESESSEAPVFQPVVPVAETATRDPASVGENVCSLLEFRGEGSAVATRSEDWQRILGQYADVKREFLKWLEQHRTDFPEKVRTFMEKQILSVKLQRHPVKSDPDLAWRGIGVFGYDGQAPIIRLGSGFSRLSEKQPTRAKFELARLIAQSILPCEITRVFGGTEGLDSWAPLLKCLQVRESQVCAPGSYSESGWAISSTVATAVSTPGCTIPAFRSPELARCLKRVKPLTASVKSAENIQIQPLWKESHR